MHLSVTMSLTMHAHAYLAKMRADAQGTSKGGRLGAHTNWAEQHSCSCRLAAVGRSAAMADDILVPCARQEKAACDAEVLADRRASRSWTIAERQVYMKLTARCPRSSPQTGLDCRRDRPISCERIGESSNVSQHTGEEVDWLRCRLQTCTLLANSNSVASRSSKLPSLLCAPRNHESHDQV